MEGEVEAFKLEVLVDCDFFVVNPRSLRSKLSIELSAEEWICSDTGAVSVL